RATALPRHACTRPRPTRRVGAGRPVRRPRHGAGQRPRDLDFTSARQPDPRVGLIATMAFAIRRLGPGDEPVLAVLAREAPEFDLAGRTAPEQPSSASLAAAYLGDPTVLHWIAEEDERVIGELLCHLLRLPCEDRRELLLYSMGVREADR